MAAHITGVSIQTQIPVTRCVDLSRYAADITAGKPGWDLLEHSRVVIVSIQLPEVSLTIQPVHRAVRVLDFRLWITAEEYGSLIQTRLDGYQTNQVKYMGLIPLSTKTIMGHKTFRLYLQNLAVAVAREDSSARAHLTQGNSLFPFDPLKPPQWVETTPAASTEAAAQADWYADPYGGSGLRYWDGCRWTEHTSPEST